MENNPPPLEKKLLYSTMVSQQLEQLENRSATAYNGSQLARCDVVSARCCRLVSRLPQ